MKKVFFLRHLKPIGKFGELGNLDLKTLSELATGKIDPGVKSNEFLLTEKILQRSGLEDIDVIFSGPKKRTKQTASIIFRKFISENVVRKVMNELDEVYFEPEVLMSEEEWKRGGMEKLRTEVYKGIMEARGAESIGEVFYRIKKLEKRLKKEEVKVIVCVTNAFLMRVIFLYFCKKIRVPKSVRLEDIEGAPIFPYGEGFTITI